MVDRRVTASRLQRNNSGCFSDLRTLPGLFLHNLSPDKLTDANTSWTIVLITLRHIFCIRTCRLVDVSGFTMKFILLIAEHTSVIPSCYRAVVRCTVFLIADSAVVLI